MSGRRSLIGLAVLCALAFCAVSAASASAKGTTAFTCVPGKGTTNSHCDPGSSGTSGHVAITAGTKTHLEVAATTNQVLKATVSGLEAELVGTGVAAQTSPFTSFIVNTDHGTEAMDVSGEVVLVYSGVVIKKTAALAERCEISGGTVTTNPLKFTSSVGETKKTTGIKFEPKEGKVFVKVHFVQKTGAKACPLAGVEAPVEGSVTGNTSGATLSVSAESESLELGGQPMTLTGTVTISGEDPEVPGTTNPLSLTTTEP